MWPQSSVKTRPIPHLPFKKISVHWRKAGSQAGIKKICSLGFRLENLPKMWDGSRQQQFLQYLAHTQYTALSRNKGKFLFQPVIPSSWMHSLPPETPTLLASCFWPTTKARIYCYQRERMLANKRYNPHLTKNLLPTGRWKLYTPSPPPSSPAQTPPLSFQLSVMHATLQDKVLMRSEAELRAVQKDGKWE